jgi:ribosomal protein L37AE/L43A
MADRLNPWMESHWRAEQGWTGGEYTARAARQRVAGEYEGHEDALQCAACGQWTGFYRATVGAYICTGADCGAMRVNGAWRLPLGGRR